MQLAQVGDTATLAQELVTLLQSGNSAGQSSGGGGSGDDAADS